MVKHIVILIVLSIIAVLVAPYLNQVLTILLHAESVLRNWLGQIFANSQTGGLIVKIVSLAVVPMVVGFIAMAIMMILKKSKSPTTEYVMWIVWLVLFTVLVLNKG